MRFRVFELKPWFVKDFRQSFETFSNVKCYDELSAGASPSGHTRVQGMNLCYDDHVN